MNKKYLWNLLTIIIVTMLCVGFASCGGDDDNEEPSNYDGDPIGTVEIGLVSGKDPYYVTAQNYLELDGSNYVIAVNLANNFTVWKSWRVQLSDPMIVSVGAVKGLGSIKSIPSSGWTSEIAARPGNGYIVHFRNEYLRMYVVEYMVDTSGGIVGVYVKYQRNWKTDNIK